MLLKAENLVKSYKDKPVLSGASFEIDKGEFVSIVGPSGEGKSTIARILCGTVISDSGTLLYNGESLFKKGSSYASKFRREIQLIPQQPYASLDPRQSIGSAISEPLLFHKIASDRADARKRAQELLERVLLSPGLYDRRAGELSGGQAQRVLIARALTVSPSLLIADEATSMLDMSSQAQIVRIFKQLIDESQLSILLISHDRPLVESVSDRIYRLSDGKIINTEENSGGNEKYES